MIGRNRVLALILARGGSKGLPGKNLRLLCGKPLIAWSIEQGRECEYVDNVVVSTDSEEIAMVSMAYGASVPFIRPAELAGDEASSMDAIFHALDTLENAGDLYDYLVVLEPTSPLREASDITGALDLLVSDSRIESVVGVAKAESGHPAFLYNVEDGVMRPMFGSQPKSLRRQDLSGDYYYLEGSVYASSLAALRKYDEFYHCATAPWVVARYKAIEIDELSDFIAAEALLNARIKGILK